MWRCFIVFIAAMAAAMPIIAQPAGTSDPGALRSEARLNVFVFDNFFWSSDPRGERDVNALGAEVRTAWRWSQAPAEVYGHVSTLRYDEEDLDTALGVRVGVAQNAPVHDYNVYVEHFTNRPSAPVRNTGFGTSDMTTLSGRYAFQLSERWQLGADGQFERQRFDTPRPRRDNDFRGVGAVARYQGFGWRITPLAGVHIGSREFSETRDDFDQRAIYAGLELIPLDPLYLSASLRNIDRNFEQGSDERDLQVELIASLRTSPRVRWLVYYLRDDISLDDGDEFDTQLALFGVSFGF